MKGTAHLYNGVNALFTTDRFQNENSAIRFTNGYYQVPAGVYFRGDFTISVWQRLSKLVNWARIIDFGNGPNSDSIFLASTTVGQPVMFIYNNSNSFTRVQTVSSLVIGNWAHVAFTLTGTTAKIYLNGTFVALTPFMTPSNTLRTRNYIGRSNTSGIGYLNADLDDLMIFNRSLSDSEVKELMEVNSLNPSTSTALSTLTSPTTTNESFSSTSTSFSTTTTIIISCVSIIILFLLTILIYFILKAINKINKIKQMQNVSNARDNDVILLNVMDNSLISSTSTSL